MPKGGVSYTLTVGIKADAPAGPLRDEIRLLSNDRETPSIPVMVTAMVRGDLTAAPSVLALGEVDSTAGKQGRFIVRASRPFAITAVEGAGDGFSVVPPENVRKTTARPDPRATSPRKARPAATCAAGFRVHTDLPGEPPLDLTATLHVAP